MAGTVRPCAVTWAGVPPARDESAMATGQPPADGWPAMAMSPPRLTRTPPRPVARHAAAAARSAPSPLAVAPRSRQTPAGSRSRRPSSVTQRQPGTGPGTAAGQAGPGSAAMDAKSRSYPSALSAPPTVGSTMPPVHRAAARATRIASASPGLTQCTRRRERRMREISESSRNRLASRSSRSSSASTAPSAAARPSGGQSATRASVPRAFRTATATAEPAFARLQCEPGMARIPPSLAAIHGDDCRACPVRSRGTGMGRNRRGDARAARGDYRHGDAGLAGVQCLGMGTGYRSGPRGAEPCPGEIPGGDGRRRDQRGRRPVRQAPDVPDAAVPAARPGLLRCRFSRPGQPPPRRRVLRIHDALLTSDDVMLPGCANARVMAVRGA